MAFVNFASQLAPVVGRWFGSAAAGFLPEAALRTRSTAAEPPALPIPASPALPVPSRPISDHAEPWPPSAETGSSSTHPRPHCPPSRDSVSGKLQKKEVDIVSSGRPESWPGFSFLVGGMKLVEFPRNFSLGLLIRVT